MKPSSISIVFVEEEEEVTPFVLSCLMMSVYRDHDHDDDDDDHDDDDELLHHSNLPASSIPIGSNFFGIMPRPFYSIFVFSIFATLPSFPL